MWSRGPLFENKKIRCTADLENHFIFKVMARKETKAQSSFRSGG